jgi:hypothetical protein
LIEGYLELGSKRVFAGAIEWPGWCRSGRDQATALDALIEYAPRYSEAMRGIRPAFHAPGEPARIRIVERLRGDSTTDFGAPSQAPAADKGAITSRDLTRQLAILQACWAALDRATDAASGVKLKKGPRGGGRDLAGILGHVVAAESGYLRALATTPTKLDDDPFIARVASRATVLDALTHAVQEGLPAAGPRGGKIWTPRYFVRRVSWHALDHAWELQDRAEQDRV